MSPSDEKCYEERAEEGPPLFQNGNIVFQVYHVGWIIAGFFAIVATVVSIWLVNKHLQWYNNKREQRYIVRILFMVPIYALVSFASFLFWNQSTILILIRDGYESTVLTAFFYLLLMYLSHDIEEQKSIFLKVGLSREADREARRKGQELKKWVFPLGFMKWKPQDGLYFLQLMKWGVLQYCVIRPTSALAAVILDYVGLYCEESWGLGWGHIYITIIVSLSVTIAMYCLIQLYVPVAENLAPHRPLLKLFAIKAVVFLTFWQATFLGVLSIFGIVKRTRYMTAADVNIGIGAILETFEMTLFAFLHISAFTYRPYMISPSSTGSFESYPERTPRLRSLGHAMDFRETFREIWAGCIYIFDKIRGREPAPDVGPRRIAHYEEAFGRPRLSELKVGLNPDKPHEETSPTLPVVKIGIEEELNVDVEGERQWLGIGDDYGYGIGYIRRERSDSLSVQIEKELKKRGYSTRPSDSPQSDAAPGNTRRQSSWWRRIYNRFSEHGSDREDERGASLMPRNKSKRRPQQNGTKDTDRQFIADQLDDPLSQSVIRQHQDGLSPLPIFTHPRIPRVYSPPGTEMRDLTGATIGTPLETRAAISSPTQSSHADSLFGRIFPRTMDSHSSNSAPSPGSLDEEGHAQLSTATRQMLGQYYEFGVGAGDTHHHTQSGVHDVRASSVVEVIQPSSSSAGPSRSAHHRESAHHHSAATLLFSQSISLTPHVDSSNRVSEKAPRARYSSVRDSVPGTPSPQTTIYPSTPHTQYTPLSPVSSTGPVRNSRHYHFSRYWDRDLTSNPPL